MVSIYVKGILNNNIAWLAYRLLTGVYKRSALLYMPANLYVKKINLKNRQNFKTISNGWQRRKLFFKNRWLNYQTCQVFAPVSEFGSHLFLLRHYWFYSLCNWSLSFLSRRHEASQISRRKWQGFATDTKKKKSNTAYTVRFLFRSFFPVLKK